MENTLNMVECAIKKSIDQHVKEKFNIYFNMYELKFIILIYGGY
jgi:hypothetical protein